MTMQTSPEWHYLIQSSGDLQTWSNVVEVIATNTTVELIDTNRPATPRFYRAIAEP